ncbi:MAG: cytochrome c maturation protein CcmE [Thermoanaerobaculia bacterium]|nr:cytochrome c maturation protein CcmE [Thermoanaerobaculia bacterium]
MRRGYWVAGVLAILFVGLGITSFQKTLTPYVSFEAARGADGAVQVMGSLDKTSDRYDDGRQELSFDLLDEQGGRMTVAYSGTRPANFKDAISIVAIGPYRNGRIEAERLLVKCPSKYQGAEVKSYGAGSPKPPAPAGTRS